MQEERSTGSYILGLLGSVFIYSIVGAVLLGFGDWLYFSYFSDSYHWDWDTMSTDSMEQLKSRSVTGSILGSVVGLILFFFGFKKISLFSFIGSKVT